MNTDHQRSQKFWTFVKCEQHSTKTHNLNSGSIIITWSDIGSSIYLSATSVTCDILCFKTTHLISTINRYYTWFTTRYSLSQNFKCNYHVWEAFRISCHQLNTFNPNFPSHFIQMDFYLQIIMGQQSVQWIGYMLEDLVFKSWQEQENYLFSRTSRSTPAPTQPPTPASSLAVNWPGLTVWPLTLI